MRYLALSILMLVFAACSSAPAATPTPALVSEVQFFVPQPGTIVFSPTLHLNGTASNLPADGFRLLVTTAEDATLADQVIQPDANGNWSAEVANTITTDPIEVTVSALPADASILGDYEIVSVVFAPESARVQEGVYGMIFAPFDGDTVGGELIPLAGAASGLFEGTLQLALIDEAGATAAQVTITTMSSDPLDEVLWAADLPTNGYLGTATIEAFYTSAKDGEKVILDSVNVTIGDAAG